VADTIAKDSSIERIGANENYADSYSNSVHRSAMGSRIGGRRRKIEFETNSRVSGGPRSQTQMDWRQQSKPSANKMKQDGFINNKIDYFYRCDLVERAIKATGYIPMALRDPASLAKLSQKHIDKLLYEKTIIERRLKKT